MMAGTELTTLEEFSGILSVKLDDVGSALPMDFNKARFVQNAIALVTENPDLGKYGMQQVINGLIKGAFLGLDFYAKEAYLVPYGNTLQYQTSYTGSAKLAKQYSIRPIKDIYAKIVREGDDFEEVIVNGEQSINFRPKPFNDGKVIGAFAVALFEDGGMQYDVMSLKELENTRSHSKAKNSPAWSQFTNEMYRKTVIKRLCKHIELNFSPEQRSIYNEETSIEQTPEDIRIEAEQDVIENANSEELPDEVFQ